jgi:hypothetical protein
MIIVPNGTKRIMVAQTFGQTMADPQLGSKELEKFAPNAGQSTQNNLTGVEQTPQIPDGLFGQEKTENSDDGSPDITDYIYKKLQSFGYPPRRLEQFENKFIDEKMYPGGLREVSITIPDRYYAKRRRLGDKDISKMVEEIGSTFGLSFVDAQRKDKSIIMNFTSQPEQNDENGEDAAMGDVLDEVYGSPSSSDVKSKKSNGKKPASKTAYTMNELIKDSKEDLVRILIKTLKENG